MGYSRYKLGFGLIAGKLVPFMAICYIGAGLVVIGLNIEAVPTAFRLIFSHAFSPIAATGGRRVWARSQRRWA